MTVDSEGVTPQAKPCFSLLWHHSTIYQAALPPIIPEDVQEKMISHFRSYLCNQLLQLGAPGSPLHFPWHHGGWASNLYLVPIVCLEFIQGYWSESLKPPGYDLQVLSKFFHSSLQNLLSVAMLGVLTFQHDYYYFYL